MTPARFPSVPRLHRLAGGAAGAAALSALAAPGVGWALPSFALQTNNPCSACHVGSFGPQLTPYGRQFKLQAYGSTQSWDGVSKTRDLALAAMIVGTYTHTNKDQSAPPADHFSTNDNLALQEASIFVAGKLAPGLGAFAQATYSGVDRHMSLDNVDVRYAREMKLFGHPAVAGVSINDNPTISDLWNTTPGWGFPYVSSDLAIGRTAAPLIAGGLAQQVVGVNPYVSIDNHLYLEGGFYKTMGQGVLNALNVDTGPTISGVAPYWRAAYNWEFNGQAAEVGVFGLSASLQPDPLVAQTDHYTDWGVDASYQFIGTKNHVFSVNASFIDERRRFYASQAAGEALIANGSLKTLSLDASYYWKKTYGLTAGVFTTRGNADNLLYSPGADTGSRTGRPDTDGYILQADWTPFGKDESWHAPWANLRVGVQYTGYTKFNGAGSNYDGFGRNASDNNTVSLFVWTAF